MTGAASFSGYREGLFGESGRIRKVFDSMRQNRKTVNKCAREYKDFRTHMEGSGIWMKTRRRLFVGLWILSLAAITCFGGAASYGFFFGMSLLPAVSLGYIAWVYFRFKIYQEIGNRTMVCGQPESFFLVLKNEDYFAYAGVKICLFSDFSYVEELKEDTEYELLPGEQYTFETRLVCRYRGEYEVGVSKVVVTDYLRLFRVSYANPSTVKALVSPRIVQLSELKSLEEFQAVLRREAFRETEQDIIVRDYVEGDSLKQIHWKATAREGKLKVRTRTGEEKQGIRIFCDTTRYSRDRREYLPLENKMLEVLLALAFFFAGKEMHFGACYGQGGVPVSHDVQGMRAFEDFYGEVDGMVFSGDEDCTGTLGQLMAAGSFRDSRVVFLILHEMDDRKMEAVSRLAAAGSLAVVYAVTDKSQEVFIRQGGGRSKIVQVPLDGELEGIL